MAHAPPLNAQQAGVTNLMRTQYFAWISVVTQRLTLIAAWNKEFAPRLNVQAASSTRKMPLSFLVRNGHAQIQKFPNVAMKRLIATVTFVPTAQF